MKTALCVFALLAFGGLAIAQTAPAAAPPAATQKPAAAAPPKDAAPKQPAKLDLPALAEMYWRQKAIVLSNANAALQAEAQVRAIEGAINEFCAPKIMGEGPNGRISCVEPPPAAAKPAPTDPPSAKK